MKLLMPTFSPCVSTKKNPSIFTFFETQDPELPKKIEAALNTIGAGQKRKQGALKQFHPLCRIIYQLTCVLSLALSTHSLIGGPQGGQLVGWGGLTVSALKPGTSVKMIDAGGSFALSLNSDGQIAAWGSDDYGATSLPSALTNLVAVSAGGYHGLVLRGDGTVAGWGGQAIVSPDLSNIVAISAGGGIFLDGAQFGAYRRWFRHSMGWQFLRSDNRASRFIECAGCSGRRFAQSCPFD
jgi:hypothetical protein